MSNDELQNLQKRLESEQERVKQLEKERDELLLKVQILENENSTYKPLGEAWLREHGPSKEECEKMLMEMQAHPEDLLDFGKVLPELLRELAESKPGGNAA